MTKQIIFIFALLCTLQAQASVQPVQKDTVRHTIHYEVAELLQPMQPSISTGCYFRHLEPATGLLAYPEVRQFFLVHLSVVKTFLDE